jgi:hypothetical protein
MNKYLKITLILLVIICLFLLSGWYKNKKLYNSVFRLTKEELVGYTKDVPVQCRKFSNCKLMPGDILIRRYVTQKTQLLDQFFHLYFTHAAVYLGNDELFEVIGGDETPQDQIIVMPLNKSRWINEDMSNFVIIRPKNDAAHIDSVITNLRKIAADPDYVFGLAENGNKKTSCGDIIVKVFSSEGMIKDMHDEPKIITPDYLFLVTQRDKTNFEIIGYN